MSSARASLAVALAARLLLAAPPATAQGGAATAAADSLRAKDELNGRWVRGPDVYGAWVAGVRHSGFKTRTGVPGHRDFYLTSIRLGWLLGGGDPTRVVHGAYFIDVVPFAVTTGMPEYVWDRWCRPGFFCPGAIPNLHTVHAYGLSPLGWALSLGSDAARFTLEASGGALWFSRRVPDPEATRFNFTASVGPTLELGVGASRVLRVGYLWHHTSNGGRGRVNPGLNSGILSVGVLRRAQPNER